ncbi:hypothetical protein HYC85_030395 [Camellia sinensis]|uniref:Retrotransposon gag domain-containing protein n=1 Tax=Camellia sinensis TaxID=4442 RepID=A0A7J7G4H9_CAMSI|nr:hypothetical protein HYC85_030395 [Camellia sinensis]
MDFFCSRWTAGGLPFRPSRAVLRIALFCAFQILRCSAHRTVTCIIPVWRDLKHAWSGETLNTHGLGDPKSSEGASPSETLNPLKVQVLRCLSCPNDFRWSGKATCLCLRHDIVCTVHLRLVQPDEPDRISELGRLVSGFAPNTCVLPLRGRVGLVDHPHPPPAVARGHRLVFAATGNVYCRPALFVAGRHCLVPIQAKGGHWSTIVEGVIKGLSIVVWVGFGMLSIASLHSGLLALTTVLGLIRAAQIMYETTLLSILQEHYADRQCKVPTDNNLSADSFILCRWPHPTAGGNFIQPVVFPDVQRSSPEVLTASRGVKLAEPTSIASLEAGLRTGRKGVLIADLPRSYPSSRAETTPVMTDTWPSAPSEWGCSFQDFPFSYPSSRAEATLVMTDTWPLAQVRFHIGLCETRFRTVTGVRTVGPIRALRKGARRKSIGAPKSQCLPSAIPERFAGGLLGKACHKADRNFMRPHVCASEPLVLDETRTRQIRDGIESEEFVAMMAALNQGIAMQDETNAEMQRLFGAPTTHPVSGPQPNFDPLLPAEDLQGPNPREGLAQAQVFRPLVQPNEGLFRLGINDLDPTSMKIANLKKQFKKAQGLNPIPDIEDGYTKAAVKLSDRFRIPHIDRFDGTLSGIAATWYAKLKDAVKQNWEKLAKAFVDQYSYNTQLEITTQDLETTYQNPTESFVEFVARWRAKAAQMTNRPSERDQVRIVVQNLEHDMLQKLIVASLFTFKSLHELGVQIKDAFNRGIIPRTSEPTRRVIFGNTNASAPSQDPNDQVPHPHLNLIHTLPFTYNPSIYITPTHLPKPEVFIPESIDLCMMDALEPQSSQTLEPTTSELMRMIEDLQRTVADLAFGILAPSSTTSHARNLKPKGLSNLGVSCN